MKTKVVFSFVCSLICLSLFAETGKPLAAKLNEAVVFFRGAELTHTVSASLVKGENEILIEGISPQIDQNSLKIRATGGALVSQYEFSTGYPSDNLLSEGKLKLMKDSLATLNKQLENVNIDYNTTDKLMKLLQDGIGKNVSGSEKGLSVAELTAAMNYYETKSKALQDAQSVNNKKKSELATAVSQLQTRIRTEEARVKKTVGKLKLTVAAPAAIYAAFTLSYFTTAASWTPYYDVNVASIDKPVKLALKSKVRQSTGLDWEKVKLTLSTSAPSTGKVAPLFGTWFLREYRPPMPVYENNSMRNNAYSYDKKLAGRLAGVEVAEIELEEVVISSDYDGYTDARMDDYVAATETDLNLTYAIDLPYTIPGDGKEQSIDLQTQEARAEFTYYSAPKLSNEAYLLAEITDWQKLNLLSGNANVTYDGAFVGSTYLDARSTLEKLSLTLGDDKRVSVKREKLTDYSAPKFLGSDMRQTFAYKMTVRNNQNKPVKLTLKDQYPLSTQKNIEVELLKKETTAWTYNKEEIGVITWETELKAGETKTFQISYSVKYPKDMKLNL